MKKRAVHRAFAVALAAAIALPPISFAEPDDPAQNVSQECARFRTDYDFTTFNWAGFEWGVRERNHYMPWGGPQAPAPDEAVGNWVNGASVNDAGDLAVRNEGIRGGVELMTTESVGYGTYTLEYSADFGHMDPSSVLGIFLYDLAAQVDDNHTTQGGFTEIDFIEISRWGEEDWPLPHAGVTYYPDDLTKAPEPGDGMFISGFDIPEGPQRLTTVAEWREGFLRVTTTTSDGTILSDVTATERVPIDNGTQQLHINLWTSAANEELYPQAQPDEVVFHSFTFNPDASCPEPSPESTEESTPASPTATEESAEPTTSSTDAPTTAPTPPDSSTPSEPSTAPPPSSAATPTTTDSSGKVETDTAPSKLPLPATYPSESPSAPASGRPDSEGVQPSGPPTVPSAEGRRPIQSVPSGATALTDRTARFIG